jgi:hypothetical protein
LRFIFIRLKWWTDALRVGLDLYRTKLAPHVPQHITRWLNILNDEFTIINMLLLAAFFILKAATQAITTILFYIKRAAAWLFQKITRGRPLPSGGNDLPSFAYGYDYQPGIGIGLNDRWVYPKYFCWWSTVFSGIVFVAGFCFVALESTIGLPDYLLALPVIPFLIFFGDGMVSGWPAASWCTRPFDDRSH